MNDTPDLPTVSDHADDIAAYTAMQKERQARRKSWLAGRPAQPDYPWQAMVHPEHTKNQPVRISLNTRVKSRNFHLGVLLPAGTPESVAWGFGNQLATVLNGSAGLGPILAGQEWFGRDVLEFPTPE